MTFGTVNIILMEGFISTCKLFFLTLLGALPLGLIICFGAMSNWAPFAGLAEKDGSKWKNRLAAFRPIRDLVGIIVWIVRGSPLMIQILIVYYGPGLLFGLPLLPR
ncbi:MAG: amino acid ABC transporter permease, partial [Oscillospiraceae bacterium]|nr:amino acid ABC transporter permease [Oscillospiraceae bacterium]